VLVAEELDNVKLYAKSLGMKIAERTILVEGTSDVGLFEMAALAEQNAVGVNLLGPSLAIVAAGEGDRGGTSGVIREFICFRGLARTLLLPNGKPRYRFVALFDNDRAGRQAVKALREVDTSILEYKDVFRLWPVMPVPVSLDPVGMQKAFERENTLYKGIEWELEDLFAHDFIKDFLSECSNAVVNSVSVEGKTHFRLTYDEKAKLHRFARHNAIRDDLKGVIEVLKALRFYLNIK
jgi:hypothetical protein